MQVDRAQLYLVTRLHGGDRRIPVAGDAVAEPVRLEPRRQRRGGRGSGGRAAAADSVSNAITAVTPTAATAVSLPVTRAGTRPRAASTAPLGSSTASSREMLANGITEMT